MYVVSMFLPGMLHGSLLTGKTLLTPFNRLVGHTTRDKVHKEETSFILNGRDTVQGEGHKDYCTEWCLSPAIELPALQSIISSLEFHTYHISDSFYLNISRKLLSKTSLPAFKPCKLDSTCQATLI